jgi:hypothetical protein
MFHISFIFLPCIFTILSMTMANPCPCELVVNESLSNYPPNSITDSMKNRLINDETLEDYFDQLTASSQSGPSSDLYPLLRQTKILDTPRERVKRPSWATVGKRAASMNKKTPSWAQVG